MGQQGRTHKSSYDSGSDSWDPIQAENKLSKQGSSNQDPDSSKDADSRANQEGPAGGDLPIKERQMEEEDMDMGGEGRGEGDGTSEKGKKKEEEGVFGEQPAQHDGRKVVGNTATVGKTLIVISDESGDGGKKGKARASQDSKDTNASVPPGFQRIKVGRPSSLAGASSPFGKLQKGGFRFIKRSSSGASSGARPTAAGPAKKNKPISSLPSQTISEVARNVGIAQPLSENQIALLKSLEEERASS